MIELGKAQIKTNLRDKRDEILNPAVRKVKNKSGVIETRVYTCVECSEEYCNGRTCLEFNYDLYTRVAPKDPTKAGAVATKALENAGGAGNSGGDGKKIKKKSKSLDADKGKSKKRNRSKSPSKKQQLSKSNKK